MVQNRFNDLPYKQLDPKKSRKKRQKQAEIACKGAKLDPRNQNVPEHNAYIKDSRF